MAESQFDSETELQKAAKETVRKLFLQEDDYDAVSDFIEQKIPYLSDDEKLQLVYRTVEHLARQADTNTPAAVLDKVKRETIQEGILDQLRSIEKYVPTKSHSVIPPITHAVRHLLHHGYIHRTTAYVKKSI